MTRKDYELIARVLRQNDEVNPPSTRPGQIRLIESFANALAKSNPTFNREKFIEACKPNWVVGSLYEKYYDRLV